ncbi:MAG: murein biosynthesis integral membrane protein MurJ [Deltaproteobacteria bacterium]
MKPIGLVSGFLTVGFWTLLSRAFGLVRDVMIAAYLGSGPVAQAFFVAFSLPNLFRRFFAEGAFNMAFVPMFAKKVESGDDPHRFAQDAFNGMSLILIVFTVIGTLGMPLLVWMMASGFAHDERFDLAVTFGRISFSYILFISLTALISGVLNGLGRFTAAAAAPVLLNVVFIAGLIISHLIGRNASDVLGFAVDDMLGLPVGATLTFSIPLGGIAQLALVWWAAKRAGYTFKLGRPRLTPELKHLYVIALPALLAGGIVQINLLVGRQVASYFDGAIVWLNLADRLYQLPLGVVGVAIGVVLLPELARRLAAKDVTGARESLSRATEFSLLFTIPAAIALIVASMPITSVLYQRGNFGDDDVANTALAVAIYGAGLPAFVLQKVWQPLFYAREDTKTPFRLALWSLAINAAFAIGLSPYIGWIATALATTVAAWTMLIMLIIRARPMGDAARLDPRARKRVFRMVLAGIIMGAAIFGATVLLNSAFRPEATRYFALLALVAIGAITFFGAAQLLGAFSLAEVRAGLRRRR